MLISIHNNLSGCGHPSHRWCFHVPNAGRPPGRCMVEASPQNLLSTSQRCCLVQRMMEIQRKETFDVGNVALLMNRRGHFLKWINSLPILRLKRYEYLEASGLSRLKGEMRFRCYSRISTFLDNSPSHKCFPISVSLDVQPFVTVPPTLTV